MREAAEKSRPILLDVYKVPCPPCRYLDEVVYRDPAVVNFINDHFIALKINGEINEVRIRDNPKIARYPTLVFLTADQQILEIREGRMDVEPFLELSKKTLAALPRQEDSHAVARSGTDGPDERSGRPLGDKQSHISAQQCHLLISAFRPARRTISAHPRDFGPGRGSVSQRAMAYFLDQSRSLVVFYPDLPESSEGRQLEQMIGPERLERFEKELVDNLGQVYWELAQAKLRQNQFSQATIYMEKIVRSCPGTRYVPAAQEFLRNRSGGRTTAELHASQGQP